MAQETSSRFPLARIKKILQKDDDVGRVQQGALVALSRSLELFLEGIVKKSVEEAEERHASTLTAGHVKACILKHGQEFDFCKGFTNNIADVAPSDVTKMTSSSKRKFSAKGDPTQPVIKKARAPKKTAPPKNVPVAALPTDSDSLSALSTDEDQDQLTSTVNVHVASGLRAASFNPAPLDDEYD